MLVIPPDRQSPRDRAMKPPKPWRPRGYVSPAAAQLRDSQPPLCQHCP
jgi:hypothetical protein